MLNRLSGVDLRQFLDRNCGTACAIALRSLSSVTRFRPRPLARVASSRSRGDWSVARDHRRPGRNVEACRGGVASMMRQKGLDDRLQPVELAARKFLLGQELARGRLPPRRGPAASVVPPISPAISISSVPSRSIRSQRGTFPRSLEQCNRGPIRKKSAASPKCRANSSSPPPRQMPAR